MKKIKKLLSLALAVAMISSLFLLPVSAAVNTAASVTFAGGIWPSDTTARVHYSSTIPTGIFGKSASDYSPAAPEVTAITDRFFQVIPGSVINIPTGGKLKVSFDIASNTFDCTDATNSNRTAYGRYVSMKLNGSTTKYLFQTNNVSLDKVYTKGFLRVNSWNNITAVFEFNESNTSAKYTMYINGKKALEEAALSLLGGTTWTTVKDFRFGGHMAAGDKLYYDNVLIETYESTDASPSVAFTTTAAATAGNEDLVDVENKTINLADMEMTVADFNSKTTGFVVLDASGNAPADDSYVVEANVYAVYANGINSYYEPYTLSIEPPVITGKTTKYATIIDNENHTIRLVDTPDMTAQDFIDNTEGATITKTGGGAIDETTLLKECSVRAVLGSVFDISYTFITTRDYALENETFDGSFSERTNTGKVYSANGLTWTGHLQGANNVTFKTLTGLGGKSAEDKSAAIVVDGTTTAATPMIYVEGNPYFVAKNENIGKTFTVESKIYIANTNDKFKSVDIIVHGRKAATLLSDGSVWSQDAKINVTSATGSWTAGKWIPIAVTYHKGTSSDDHEMDVYIAGVKIKQLWKCKLPTQNEIRFVVNCEAGANVTLAVDDVKLYTDSLEKYKYTVSGSTVTLKATDSLKCVPILTSYNASGELVEVKLDSASKTVTIDYAEGQFVRAMLWESLKTLVPITESITIVDRGNSVNSYTAVLSAAFTDDMVLQRDMPVTVWGTSADENGSTLSVSLGNETKTAYVNDGKWEVAFSAREASSEGEKLTVTTSVGTQTVENIAFGDVYFVGGQSNAYLPMNAVDTYNDDKDSFTASNDIRIFHQAGTYAQTVQANPISGSKWEIATSSTIGKMSAIGSYFAKTLKNNGINVPIGLISFAHNGTSLHHDIPSSITKKYTIDYINPEKTSQSYNAMLAPVEKFAAKGMLWYQGENDSINSIIAKSTANYDDMFSEFVAHMKETTGNVNLKVFTVQLSSHSINEKNPAGTENNATLGWNIPRFRAFQYDLVNNMRNVYIVPSLDCGFRNGDTDAAHPIYKKPIGERLAKAALYAIYNKETENNALAPMPENVSYNGATVTIKFKHTGTGLIIANGTELKGFELIDENGKAYSATAQLSGTDTVVITSSSVAQAEGVRYAFYQSAPVTIANLANSGGLPCLTFAHDKDSDNGTNSAAIAAVSLGEMLNK